MREIKKYDLSPVKKENIVEMMDQRNIYGFNLIVFE